MALEKGIAAMVEGFIAAGRPSVRNQTFAERRAGYIASASLAGESLGLDGLLVMDGFAPELLEEAAARVAEIAARLPGGSGAGSLPLGDDIDVLLAEARDLLLSRAAEAG